MYISWMKGGGILNTTALNTVYNHYLTTYAPKGTSPYDTHKKSELRSVYNSIIKLNKESPLYLMDNTKDTHEFAVGIKEGARDLRNTIVSLGGVTEDEMLNKKKTFSSNENIAAASYIGDSTDTDSVPTLELEVKNLASPQVNTGIFLSSTSLGLPIGAYSFDIGINDLNYEFQFNINEGDTNKDLQDRLSRLITNSNIGVDAITMEDALGNSALRLQSNATGMLNGKDVLFTVTDDKTSKTAGAVNYLGINEVTRPAANSSFLLNGQERATASNNFTIEKTYEITLNGLSPTEGDTTTIGLKNDTESFTENINHLVNGYNDFIRAASEHLNPHTKNSTLLSEMNRISSYYHSELDSLGLQTNEEGYLSVDKKQLENAADFDDANELFSSVKDFANSLFRKSNEVSLNPMQYVHKTMIAYKNPGKSFASPYVTSAYSGMMFNSYC